MSLLDKVTSRPLYSLIQDMFCSKTIDSILDDVQESFPIIVNMQTYQTDDEIIDELLIQYIDNMVADNECI